MERPAAIEEEIWETWVAIYNAVPNHRRTADIPTTDAEANTSIRQMLPYLLDLRAAAAAAAAPAANTGDSSYKLFDVKDVPEWKGKDKILPWLRGFRDFANGYTVRSGDVQSAIFRCKARITQEPTGSWFQETDVGTFVVNGDDGRPEWGPSWLAFAQHLEALLVPKDWYERSAEAWLNVRRTASLDAATDFTDYRTRFQDALNKYNVARRAANFQSLPQDAATQKFVENLPSGIYDEIRLKHSDVLARPWDHYAEDFTIAWNKVKGTRRMALQANAEEAEVLRANVRQVVREQLEAEVDFIPRRKKPATATTSSTRCAESWDLGPADLRGPLIIWKGMDDGERRRVVHKIRRLIKERRCANCRRTRGEHNPTLSFTDPGYLEKTIPAAARHGPAEEESGPEDTEETPFEENS